MLIALTSLAFEIAAERARCLILKTEHELSFVGDASDKIGVAYFLIGRWEPSSDLSFFTTSRSTPHPLRVLAGLSPRQVVYHKRIWYQTEIVRLIRQKKADYVLALKSNHSTIYHQVKDWFETAKTQEFMGIEMSYDSRTEKGHPRLETRKVWAVSLAKLGGLYKQEQWAGLRTIVMSEKVRHLWNKTTHDVQFYLSSLPVDAQLNGRAIRQYWSIENQVHWSLDVTFNEDKSRICSLNSPQNFALIRRIALNAVNQETTLQRSLRQKIKRAAMNNDYMMQILKCFCQA